MTVKDRLKEFIKYKGIPVRKFEDTIGVSHSYVSNIRVSIQPDKMQSIAKYYPELNSGWLLTGEGSMLREKETSGNHFRGDGNSYINVGSGTLSQNAKETNSEMYVKRIAELEEENKELRHKIDQLTADLLKSKERIINLLERE